MKKKIVSGLMAVVIMFTMVPQSAFAYTENAQLEPENSVENVESEAPDESLCVEEINEQGDSDDETQGEVLSNEQSDTKSETIIGTNNEEQIKNQNKDKDVRSKKDQEKIETSSDIMEGVLVDGDLLNEPDPLEFPKKTESADGIIGKKAAPKNVYDFIDDEEYDSIISQMTIKNSWSSDLKDVHVDVKGFGVTKSNRDTFIAHIFNSSPELFYYENRYSYSYRGNEIIKFTFHLNGKVSTIKKQQAKIDKAVAEVDALVKDDMSAVEKVLLVHDYLAFNTAYDYDGILNGTEDYTVYDIYGVFGKKVAVCQGYAMAAEYLLNRYGVPCGIASSDDANHAWNVVRLNGKWYHMDITWDDPVYDNMGRVTHKYMLLSEKSLLSMEDCDNRSDYVTMVRDYRYKKAVDNSYKNYFWKNSNAYIHYYKGLWYYMDSDEFKLMSYDFDSKKIRRVMDDDDLGKRIVWKNLDNPRNRWVGNYSKVLGENNKLYFTTPDNIYLVDLSSKSKNPKNVYSNKVKDKDIYGLGEFNDVLLYTAKKSPKSNACEAKKKMIHSTNISLDCATKITKTVTTNGELSVTYKPVKIHDKNNKLVQTKYKVYYKKASEKKYKAKTTTNTKYTLKGLTKNCPYNVKVKPYYISKNGDVISGQTTGSVKLVTNTANKYIPTGKFKASYLSDPTQLRIQATKPSISGGKISYQVSYKKSNSKEYTVKTFKSSKMTLKGLKKNAKYNVRVRYVYQDSKTGDKVYSRYSDTKTVKTKSK